MKIEFPRSGFSDLGNPKFVNEISGHRPQEHTFASTVFTTEEFDQNPGRAMKAADKGPVFITDNGRQTYVLLTIDEYRKITGKKESILDLLAMPEMAEIDDDFEFPRMGDELFRPIYLS